jgi:hypothetical protein
MYSDERKDKYGKSEYESTKAQECVSVCSVQRVSESARERVSAEA